MSQNINLLPALKFLGQDVGLGLVADELEILRPVGVVEDDGPEAISLDQQELDLAEGDAVGEGVLEPGAVRRR